MRVVHISSSDQHGGASLAAQRLNAALRVQGIDSRLLVADRSAVDASVETIGENIGPSEHQAADAAIRHVYRDSNRTAASNTHFTVQVTGVDLRGHSLIQEADVIHLHWVSSFLTPQSIYLLHSLNKPIIWTLHDFEPFTGGCHFPAGCDRYTTTCAPCPQLRNDPFEIPANVLLDKLDLLNNADLTLIAPSRWMAARAKQSRVFQQVEHIAVIPNCVDTGVFAPRPAGEARRALGLSEAATYILVVADQGLQSRKGFDLLEDLIERCGADPGFRAARASLLLVGRECPPLDSSRVPFTYIGELKTEQEMALAYSASDIVLLPSLEDNLPNVMLEGLAAGTPIVAFDVGGIPEVVVDGTHGRILRPGDIDGMAQAILSIISDRRALEAMRAQDRELVEATYSYSLVADQHAALYASALGRQGAPSSLRSYVADPGPAVSRLLPELRLYCLEEEVRRLQHQLRESEQDRRDQLGVIESLTVAVNERLSLIQRLQTELLERAALLDSHQSELRERGALIDRLDSELRQRATLIDQLDSELRNRGALIDRLDSEARISRQLNAALSAELAARRTVTQPKERAFASRLTLVNALNASFGFGRRALHLLVQQFL